MKNTQLRRGNKVLHNGIEKTIDCISPGYVILLEDRKGTDDFGQWVNLDEVEFIPLTEEWLIEKMKFHKQNNQIYSIGLKLFISWWNTNSIEIDINGEVLIINCKYVHELQNIYFALTGEELELKVDALQ